jgi:multidrug efflux pump subunit AcrB
MKVIDFAIRRRVTIIMCTVAIALFGVVSLTRPGQPPPDPPTPR